MPKPDWNGPDDKNRLKLIYQINLPSYLVLEIYMFLHTWGPLSTLTQTWNIFHIMVFLKLQQTFLGVQREQLDECFSIDTSLFKSWL